MYHLYFYLIWKVVKKHKIFFWEWGVRYNLSGSVHILYKVCPSVTLMSSVSSLRVLPSYELIHFRCSAEGLESTRAAASL